MSTEHDVCVDAVAVIVLTPHCLLVLAALWGREEMKKSKQHLNLQSVATSLSPPDPIGVPLCASPVPST